MKVFKNKKGIVPLLLIIPLIIVGGLMVIFGVIGLIALWRFLKIAVPILALAFVAFLIYWGYLKLVKKETVHFKKPTIAPKIGKWLVTGTIFFFIFLYAILPDFFPGFIDDAIVAAIGIYLNKFIVKRIE